MVTDSSSAVGDRIVMTRHFQGQMRPPDRTAAESKVPANGRLFLEVVLIPSLAIAALRRFALLSKFHRFAGSSGHGIRLRWRRASSAATGFVHSGVWRKSA